jgi:hypothetical protein
VRRKAGKKPTPSAAILDSQSVKTDAPSKTIEPFDFLTFFFAFDLNRMR